MNHVRPQTLVVVLLVSTLTLAGCSRSTSTNSQNSRTQSNSAQGQLVDLNSCSKADLVRLPGIGDAYAQRIIDHRPYREKTDLLNRDVIPESAYRQIADKVIARQH